MKFIELPGGKSVKGEKIPAFKSTFEGPTYVYILGAVHGDEIEGAYLAQKLYEWLKDTTIIEIPLIIVPVVNVDGLAINSRTNANGVDLNRNLPSTKWTPVAREAKYFPGTMPLSEPENQLLVELFTQYPPRFILSFHSWYPVINYNGACKEVAEFLAKYNNYPIEADFDNHPTPGSLGEYATEKFQSPVLTFECPVLSETVSLESIWKENENGFKQLFITKLINTFKS